MKIKNIIDWIAAESKIVRDLIHQKIYMASEVEKDVVRNFHQLFYNAAHFKKTWVDTYWLGVPVWKCPFDLWVYQEMIFEQKPDLIIETGTAHGGSAFFMASMCDLVDNGRIVTIDVSDYGKRPPHKRISYLLGSSTSDAILEKVKSSINKNDKVLVILDSDHSKRHVLDELRIYNKFVTEGSYLVVEDTNINGHPVKPTFGPGPMEAVEEFLKESGDFAVDKSREKFYLTFNPGGYLRKTKRA